MFEITYLISSKLEEEYSEKLTGSGIASFCFEKVSGKLFLKVYSDTPCEISWIKSSSVHIAEIHDSDWKNRWAAGYTGHELTPDVFVLPPGAAYPEKEYRFLILIDPEDSFGDGHHPTTRLCGTLLENVIEMHFSPAELSLIDIGTGSGVLAILAALSGVRDIELFDYDRDSVVKAGKNLRLNGISWISAGHNDLYVFSSAKKYDIITANLLSKIIEDNIERLKTLLKPDGYMILSGISSKWRKDMSGLFKKSDLKIIFHKTLEEWEGFVLKLNS